MRNKTPFKLPGVGFRTKLIMLLIVAASLWWVISNPVGAACTVTDVVDALVTFVGSLGD